MSGHVPTLVSRNVSSSEELRGVVTDGEVRNSFDKLFEGQELVHFADDEHAECLHPRVEPTFERANCGNLVAGEEEPAPAGKL